MAASNSSSGSDSTPTLTTLSTSTVTPTKYSTRTHKPNSQSSGSLRSQSLASVPVPPDPPEVQAAQSNSRIPVTPAVLRAIFASSRAPGEERSLSRVAFFRFTGFLISCLGITLIANRGRGIRTGAALLGVGVV